MRARFFIMAILAIAIPSYGAIQYRVLNDETRTSTIPMDDPEDSSVIEPRGAHVIPPLSGIGIDMTDRDQTTQNFGSIATTGAAAHAINSTGLRASITSTGTIETTGAGAVGINSTNDDVVITTSGSITTTGTGASTGIFTTGGTATIRNNADITTVGNGAIGISSTGGGAAIFSGGSISTTGTGSHGFSLTTGTTTVRNDGTILTTGSGSFGVNNDTSPDVIFTNNGTITTSFSSTAPFFNEDSPRLMFTNTGTLNAIGTTAEGFFNTGSSDVTILNTGKIISTASGIFNDTGSERLLVRNSGTIFSSGGSAVALGVTSDVMIINSGLLESGTSDAVGGFSDNVQIVNSGTIRGVGPAIVMDGANPTLTLLRGSNVQGSIFFSDPLTLSVEKGLNLFMDLDGTFATLNIDAPHVQVGTDVVGVIDPTGLTLQPDVIADLSDTILDGIYRHRLGCCTPCGCGSWIQAIGSYRNRNRAHDHIGYDNWQAGFLVGYDKPMCRGNIGLFAGFSHGEAEVDQHTQKAFINSYIAGATYETCFCDTFIGLALTAGYIDWDNNRYVMNNLAPDGVEIAQANIDGLFLSPELTLARQFSAFCVQPVMTFNLRYVGFYPGDYSESGSASNFSVDSRHINLLTTRLEAALPYSNMCGKCCWSIEPYIGVYGRYQLSDTHIDGELLGQDLDFSQPGPRNVAAFLTGFRGIQSFGCVNFTLNLEASFDSNSSVRLLGEGGVGWNF